MDIKAITKRLDALQAEADKNRPCRMTVTFTDGHQIVTDPCGAIDLCREHGSNIADITADRAEYAAAAGIMTVLCHPAKDREVSNFE